MTSRPAANDELSELLLTLATETDMSSKAVRAAIERAPEFEADILSFALEWCVMCEEDAPTTEHPRSPAALPEALITGAPVRDPFFGKTPNDLRALATLCDLPFSLFAKLCQRVIDATTIPLALIRSLAAHLNVDAADLLAFLDRQPTLAIADYRTTVRPAASKKVSFAAAIRSTDMSTEQRDKWLSLAE